MIFETLHLCNVNDTEIDSVDIDLYLKLVENNDGVVFYSKVLNPAQFNQLNDRMTTNRVYFVVDDNIHNLKTIGYDEWLELVNKYKKTFTWK